MTYYSTAELGKLLDLHPETVRRLASQGQIPGARKLGKSWRISADRFHAAFDADTLASTPAGPEGATGKPNRGW